ncbi:MAG TPA: hypothetical protein VMK12_25125, partial [Anaeromyxobacteraceae bacterium]|nr:hypothetical protein [Anaeromyxobacteraceae bacterium]
LLVLLVGGCAAPTASLGAGTPASSHASPLTVARAFYGALHGGDAEGAAKLLATPNARTATNAFVTLSRAYRDLEKAVGERFGAEATHAVGYGDGVAAEEEALRRASEEISGDEAVVTAGNRTLATLRRIDGTWRVLLSDSLSTSDGLVELAQEAVATQKAAARVAPAVRQGFFNGPEDALEAFRNDVASSLVGQQDLGEAEPPGFVSI